jgi:deoxyhypusine synthase
MIDTGMVQAVVSTGALLAHGLSESLGMVHDRHDARMSDAEYVEAFTSRALDTLSGELSSELICRALGRALAEGNQGTGVLRSAYEKGVPVYVPAFTDSELGHHLATWAMRKAQREGVKESDFCFDVLPPYNPFLDLNSFARFILSAERLGIFTIGGGVPRNWAQELGPYIEIINERLRLDLKPPRYHYAVRICPEPTHWGGLSGCTYSEGVSWGKFVPPRQGSRFAEIYADATTIWPLLILGVLEEVGEKLSPQEAKTRNAHRASG